VDPSRPGSAAKLHDDQTIPQESDENDVVNAAIQTGIRYLESKADLLAALKGSATRAGGTRPAPTDSANLTFNRKSYRQRQLSVEA